jgi:AcrR family transcriptional regulator
VQPLRSRLKAATAQDILLAAEEAFAETGVREAGMQAIAARAGVAVGTIYNHFPDREGLLRALFEMRKRQLAARLDEVARASSTQPFRQQLEAYVRAMFAFVEEHRPFVLVALGSEPPPLSVSASPTAVTQIRGVVERLVRVGIKEGALRPDPAGLFPAVLSSTLRGVIVETARRGGSFTELAGPVIEAFLHGAAR